MVYEPIQNKDKAVFIFSTESQFVSDLTSRLTASYGVRLVTFSNTRAKAKEYLDHYQFDRILLDIVDGKYVNKWIESGWIPPSLQTCPGFELTVALILRNPDESIYLRGTRGVIEVMKREKSIILDRENVQWIDEEMSVDGVCRALELDK